MTHLSPVALRRHTQLVSHATAQYWRKCEVENLFELPFLDLVFQAASVHRQHFDANKIQLSTLLSIKTGGCPEDCEYCPQSAHYHTNVEKSELLNVQSVVEKAKIATRFQSQIFNGLNNFRYLLHILWLRTTPSSTHTKTTRATLFRNFGFFHNGLHI